MKKRRFSARIARYLLGHRLLLILAAIIGTIVATLFIEPRKKSDKP